MRRYALILQKDTKKYYKLELPLGSLAIAVSILSVAKNTTVKDLSELAILIGLAIFGFWNLFANLATTVDHKSD